MLKRKIADDLRNWEEYLMGNTLLPIYYEYLV